MTAEKQVEDQLPAGWTVDSEKPNAPARGVFCDRKTRVQYPWRKIPAHEAIHGVPSRVTLTPDTAQQYKQLMCRAVSPKQKKKKKNCEKRTHRVIQYKQASSARGVCKKRPYYETVSLCFILDLVRRTASSNVDVCVFYFNLFLSQAFRTYSGVLRPTVFFVVLVGLDGQDYHAGRT